MSKAFTKEDDANEEELPLSRSTLPPGVPNYLTAGGARRMGEELARLQEERSRLRGDLPDEDAAHRLRRLEIRLRELGERFESAQVVTPREEPTGEVQFGATVTVRDGSGSDLEYRIVGVDEADFDRGWISWQSPLARSLMGRRIGERVTLKTPVGERALEILRISFEE